MITVLKVRMPRHDFDAFNASLQQYIPAFCHSNRADIALMKDDDRVKLSRRILISLIDDVRINLNKLAWTAAHKTVTFKLSEAGAIALYYLLQQLPISQQDQFTLRVVNTCIADLHHYIVSPSSSRPVPKYLQPS